MASASNTKLLENALAAFAADLYGMCRSESERSAIQMEPCEEASLFSGKTAAPSGTQLVTYLVRRVQASGRPVADAQIDALICARSANGPCVQPGPWPKLDVAPCRTARHAHCLFAQARHARQL